MSNSQEKLDRLTQQEVLVLANIGKLHEELIQSRVVLSEIRGQKAGHELTIKAQLEAEELRQQFSGAGEAGGNVESIESAKKVN